MFRTIFNCGRSDLSAFTARFCTKQPIRKIIDSNDVKIVGTVVKDSHVLPSGTHAFFVKTQATPTRYTTHAIQSNGKLNFLAGQRIYVTGRLKSSKYELDGKQLSATVVRADQVHVIEHGSGQNDENTCKMVGNVAGDVSDTDGATFFTIASHFNRRTENGEQELGTHFHQVVSYDKAVRQYMLENIKKSDRVFAHGSIGHRTRTGSDGKKLVTGYIVADKVYKIGRRTSTSEEKSNDDDHVKAESNA